MLLNHINWDVIYRKKSMKIKKRNHSMNCYRFFNFPYADVEEASLEDIATGTGFSYTLSLKELEADQLVHRVEYPQIPPKVEYSLTECGKSLMPISILHGICWIRLSSPAYRHNPICVQMYRRLPVPVPRYQPF